MRNLGWFILYENMFRATRPWLFIYKYLNVKKLFLWKTLIFIFFQIFFLGMHDSTQYIYKQL